LRCLLVETPDALVLIDAGVGNKDSAKFRDIYGIENESRAGRPSRLEDALAAAGFGAADVDVVINTHLHFDHAGGNTHRDGEGRVALSFPRARYVAQRGEYEYAHWHNERVQASYLPDNFDPVLQAGRLELVQGEVEVVPGVLMVPTPGHTPNHTSILLQSEGRTACFLADLVPTAAHLPLPWIMGYDVEPLVTLESKRRLLGRARAEDWLLVFEHDPGVAWGRLHPQADHPNLAVSNEGA
jgi:glyoxylase-like metal-dependent hydrolase (beta-lactamase superfamily II)